MSLRTVHNLVCGGGVLIICCCMVLGCRQQQREQSREDASTVVGTLEKIENLNNDWVRLTFQEGMHVDLINDASVPLYVGHHQTIITEGKGYGSYQRIVRVDCPGYYEQVKESQFIKLEDR